MAYRVLLAGGGSGGHIYPLIAVAQSLRSKAKEQHINLQMLMMGSGGFVTQIAGVYDIPVVEILSGKLRRYASTQTATDILKLPLGFVQAVWHMFWFMPDVVFAKGGYASVLPVLAARLFWIPVYLHETDVVPGLANRILARRARKVFVSFESSVADFDARKTEVVGNPIRAELFTADRAVAYRAFNLDVNKKTVVVLGGSQGSKNVNSAVLAGLVQMLQLGYQIVHQCGESQLDTVRSEVDAFVKEGEQSYGNMIANQYRLVPFLSAEQVAQAYAIADVFISRAGGVIFELAVVGKPVILIPLSASANDHQLKNALEFVAAGAMLVEEQNLTPHLLIHTIQSVLDPQVYGSISQRIKAFAKPDAAARIADVLLS